MDPKENIPQESLAEVLSKVINDANYLVGTEPEGSKWNFKDWESTDFREINPNSFVVQEKAFKLITIDDRALPLRIIQTDPKQTPLQEEYSVSYIIQAIQKDIVPTVIVATDKAGNEVILTQQFGEDINGFIGRYFGNIKRNQVRESKDASNWAAFLKDVLTSKQFLPALFLPPKETVRAELEMDNHEKVTKGAILMAELQMTEQEVLGMLYADYVVQV